MPVWLDRVNYYRSLANLPAVSEDPNLSAGDNDAATYMILNNTITHTEVAGNPGYTAAGAAAAAASDIAVYYTQLPPQTQMVDEWMSGAFHGPNMLDPRLQTVGFGTYQDRTAPGYQSATALNVESGKTGASAFPVYWPGNNQTVSLTSYSMYGTEWPDARASCSGYASPDLPITLQLGPGNVESSSTPGTSGVTASSLMLGSTALTACEIDEFTYTNPQDASGQSWGRSVLAGQGTVVLLPQAPLAPGNYSASITVNGMNYTWSFTVGTVTSPITLTYSGPETVIAGQSVNGSWTASGGSGGPYTFAHNGKLQPNLILGSNGILSGIALGSGFVGVGTQFSVTATDNNGQTSAPQMMTLVVEPPPITVTPSGQLPVAVPGQSYSVQLSASGGVAPYTFPSVDFTNTGLSMNSQGLISGTAVPSNDTFHYEGGVSDTYGSMGHISFYITFQSSS